MYKLNYWLRYLSPSFPLVSFSTQTTYLTIQSSNSYLNSLRRIIKSTLKLFLIFFPVFLDFSYDPQFHQSVTRQILTHIQVLPQTFKSHIIRMRGVIKVCCGLFFPLFFFRNFTFLLFQSIEIQPKHIQHLQASNSHNKRLKSIIGVCRQLHSLSSLAFLFFCNLSFLPTQSMFCPFL